MLFGSKDMQNDLLLRVRNCEKEYHIKVIYGALVGSISKGHQLCDSDYDTRFLFINKDFPNKIYIPEQCKEDNIIYRKQFPNTIYEKLPFWELSSFFQYLICPSIDYHFSVGLYNVVGWTFLSPYSWDPYGIQQKVIPIIQNSFYSNYLLCYYKNLLMDYKNSNEKVHYKTYIDRIYYALACNWIFMKNEFPPVNIFTLATLTNSTIYEAIRNYVDDARKSAEIKKVSGQLHSSTIDMYAYTNSEIDDFIESIINRLEGIELIYMDDAKKGLISNFVNQIYNQINYSVYQECDILNID